MHKSILLFLILFLSFIMIFPYSTMRAENGKRISNDVSFQELTTIAEIERALKSLLDLYQIDFYIGKFKASDYANYWSKWENLTSSDAKSLGRYVKLFIEEWGKYPIDWIKGSNLKAIAFVKKLNVVNQYRAAMPDAYGEVLYYDIGYEYAGEEYERKTIHHEYYHMIEENYFGDMYYKDKEWANLNEPDFKYGQGGSKAYEESDFVNKEHPFNGFIDIYSTYGLEEDKAQVYTYLMTTEPYKRLMEWIKTDKILANKVKYMKNFIREHSPEMTDEYFYKIHLMNTNTNETNNDILLDEDTIENMNNKENKNETKINNISLKEYIASFKDTKVRKKFEEFVNDGIEKTIDTKGVSSDTIIGTAKKFLGTPHKTGGTDRNGIDCSGLVMVVLEINGITFPHNANDQARYGKMVFEKSSLKKGDLVFFINTYKTTKFITHVGIYLGEGDFIHTSSKNGVMISSLEKDNYWKERYIFGTRILND